MGFLKSASMEEVVVKLITLGIVFSTVSLISCGGKTEEKQREQSRPLDGRLTAREQADQDRENRRKEEMQKRGMTSENEIHIKAENITAVEKIENGSLVYLSSGEQIKVIEIPIEVTSISQYLSKERKYITLHVKK